MPYDKVIDRTITIDGHAWRLFQRRDFAGGCHDPHCADPGCKGNATLMSSPHSRFVEAVYRGDLAVICLYCAHCGGTVGCFRIAEDLQ